MKKTVFIFVIGMFLCLLSASAQTVSVHQLYQRWNAEPVSGMVSVAELQADSKPVSGTVSIQQLRGENAATSLPVDISNPLPRMSPELALDAYLSRAEHQNTRLGAYTAETVIEADLPEVQQHGEYQLQRTYSAPNIMKFKAVRFEGDGSVKTNVISRLLTSEVQNVEKNDGALTAINASNYKFNYRSDDQIGGRVVHVYAVKPHDKRVGLFKGHIFVDVSTGTLVRAEGEFVKSPSVFVKDIEFVQDYDDFGAFTLPTHLHTSAKAKIYGKTVVEVDNRNYQTYSDVTVASLPTPSVTGNH